MLLMEGRPDRWAGFTVQDVDRVESGKAAAVAGAAGALASLPYAVALGGTAESALLSGAGVALSCALFGVVYRYARRSDVLDNHLKVRFRFQVLAVPWRITLKALLLGCNSGCTLGARTLGPCFYQHSAMIRSRMAGTLGLEGTEWVLCWTREAPWSNHNLDGAFK